MKKAKKKKTKKKEKLTSKWSLKKPLFVEKSDKRYKKHVKQLKENGFSDAETWCLFAGISEFILPRLKRFKEINNGYPGDLTEAKWDKILDNMIFAFEWAVMDGEMTDEYMDLSDKKKEDGWKKYEEGMKLFGEYFMGLWW